MLTILGVVITVIITAMRVYRRGKTKEIRMLSLLVMLGLITYYVHGLMNNFLDSDKASVPFWGFTAILVAMDLYHSEDPKAPVSETAPEDV